MLFGRVSRKMILAHPRTNSSILSYQTRLEQMRLAPMVRRNKKKCFLAANTQDEFVEHMDKKYPMCTVKYTAVFLYFCWRSWTSCLDTWHHGFCQIPTDKKKKISDWLLEILLWAMFGSSNRTIIQKQHKNGSLSTKPSCYGHSSPLTWTL